MRIKIEIAASRYASRYALLAILASARGVRACGARLRTSTICSYCQYNLVASLRAVGVAIPDMERTTIMPPLLRGGR